MCRPLLCFCRLFLFCGKRCLDSNPECCRSKSKQPFPHSQFSLLQLVITTISVLHYDLVMYVNMNMCTVHVLRLTDESTAQIINFAVHVYCLQELQQT